jgi:sugar phosphate isomerase/epimerase
MMEVACSTIGFGMLPLPDALDHIAARGFTEVEVGVLGDFCPHLDPAEAGEASIGHYAEVFRRSGLRPVAINSAPRLYCDDPADRDELVRAAHRLLALAAGLGCDLIVDAGEREKDEAAGLGRAADVIGGCFRAGRDQYGVTVTVEAPHRGMSAETVPEALRLLGLIGEDELGITYDTSHATCGGIPAAEGLDLIGHRIARVQARDHRGADIHLTPGDGEYDWQALARFLASAPRPVCLELEFDRRLSAVQVAAEVARGRDFLLGLTG